MSTGQIDMEAVAKSARLPLEEEASESLAERILGDDDDGHR